MTSTAAALQRRARDPRAALDRAVAAMGVRRRAEVEVLEAALVFAHAHVVGDQDRSASWTPDSPPDSSPGSPSVLWGEQAVPLAGPGRRWSPSSPPSSSPPPWGSPTRPRSR